MVARGTKRSGRIPAAMLVIIAGGLAGCTSGPPGVQTASQDATAAGTPVLLESESPVAARSLAGADKPTLADRVRGFFKKPDFKKPQWVDNLSLEALKLDALAGKDVAPPDPFVLARTEARRESAESFVDYTPVSIQPVSYEAAAGATADPAAQQAGAVAAPTAGKSQVTPSGEDLNGHRTANPFLQPESDVSYSRRPVKVLATSLAEPSAEPARTDHRTQSVTNYLAAPRDEPTGVLNSDMIVDSYLVPSRDDEPVEFVAAEVVPQEPDETRKKDIQPTSPPMRQPFGEANWSKPRSAPTVSANVPKSVMPEISPSPERPSVSGDSGTDDPAFSGSELFVPVDEEPEQRPVDPFGDVEGKSHIEIESSAAKANPDALGEGVARSKSVEAPRPDLPVQIAAARTGDAPPSHGLELATAKQLAASQATTPDTPEIGSKVAVGLGLAAIIAGAVMIRGRLS